MTGLDHRKSLKTIIKFTTEIQAPGFATLAHRVIRRLSRGGQPSREWSLLQALPWLFTAIDSNSSAVARDFLAVSRRTNALSSAHLTT